MENLFSRLIKCRPRHDQTSKENFITELFCGIFDRMPSYKELVLRLIFGKLNVVQTDDFSSWEALSQYSLAGNGIADIVLVNDKKIILIEHKVDSSPYNDQLENYHRYLDKNNGVGLILLTKKHSLDYKNNNKYKPPYGTIFWHEIVDEMGKLIKEKKIEEANLNNLKEFFEFLIEEEMKMKGTFEPIDFVTIQNAADVFQLMDRVLDGPAKEILKEIIPSGKLAEGPTPRTQLRDYGRYIYYGTFNTDISILIGFFVDQDEKAFFDEGLSKKAYPVAYLSVEVKPKAQSRQAIRRLCEDFVAMKKEWRVFPNSKKWWDVMTCSLSLKSLNTDDHVKEINEWWMTRLAELKEFLVEKRFDRNSIN